MLKTLLRGFAPAAIAAMSLGLSGCDFHVSVGDTDGVPLAELDQSGPAPTKLVAAGPDKVIITTGSELGIEVEGDADGELRFSLEDGELAISREKSSWSDGDGATVRVTMPEPEELTIAGSGKVEVDTLANDSEVLIGGSGDVTIAALASDRLDVSIGGSGSLTGAGKVEKFDLKIGGNGDIEFANVQIGRADINIGGSGDVRFASDGTVEANIAGSGDITVTGNAECTLKAFGSGTLNCKPAADTAPDDAGGTSEES